MPIFALVNCNGLASLVLSLLAQVTLPVRLKLLKLPTVILMAELEAIVMVFVDERASLTTR